MNPKIPIELNGYYLLVGELIYQVIHIYPDSYHCRVYDLKGHFKKEDTWSKNYIHTFAIKRVKPKGPNRYTPCV